MQWAIPAIGVRPPLRTLAAVLAMAPVAGIPPKKPEKIFPRPCPTQFGIGFVGIADHSIGYNCGQQGLNSLLRTAMVNAGDDHLLYQVHGKGWNMERRKSRIQFSIHTSNGVDRKFCKISDCSGNNDGNQRPRNFISYFCPK